MKILLAGSPNSGKTTLFNAMTGIGAKTVNYPGSTVELSVGSWLGHTVIDSPGVYSLEPRSADEEITQAAIAFESPDVIVAVLDATQMSRQLVLIRQLARLGRPVVVALSMIDLLERDGGFVDFDRLRLELGLQCLPVTGRVYGRNSQHSALHQKRELDALAVAVNSAVGKNPAVGFLDADRDWERAREIEQISVLPVDTVHPGRGNLFLHSPRAQTRAIDRVVLHPIWGLVLFLAMMAGLFSSIYWMATPLMDGVDCVFGYVNEAVLALAPRNIVVRFVSEGLIAGAGAVLIFVPQIFILFLGVIALEDSGYLARAATIVDRPLRAIGLGGRSFVPLLAGFACAVPAMLASRSISSRRERFLTLFILPLMSCSARLPVYALLIGFLFSSSSWRAGSLLALLYFASLSAGAVAAIVAGRLGLFKGERSFLLMELPYYRVPSPVVVVRQAILRTQSYVRRAGAMILGLSVCIWVGTTFPDFSNEDHQERLERSYLGQAGSFISPVFEPMGGDWRTGIGLMSAFAAREVFVSTMAVLFHVTDSDEDGMRASLLDQMRKAKTKDGAPLFTVASVVGLLVFFIIALQCLSTFSIAAKETGSWVFAWTQLISFNLVAYILAVFAVQGLRAFGVP